MEQPHSTGGSTTPQDWRNNECRTLGGTSQSSGEADCEGGGGDADRSATPIAPFAALTSLWDVPPLFPIVVHMPDLTAVRQHPTARGARRGGWW
jgi:hypothetical protein